MNIRLFSLLLVAFLFLEHQAYAMLEPSPSISKAKNSQEAKKPTAASGQFIIAFTDDLSEPADVLLEGHRPFAGALSNQDPSIDKLIATYNVISAEQIFANNTGLKNKGSRSKTAKARKQEFNTQIA